MIDVKKAMEEVQNKTLHQIQKETAYVWTARAVACLKLYEKTQELKWLWNYDEYRHESIEHAALAEGKHPGFLKKIMKHLPVLEG